MTTITDDPPSLKALPFDIYNELESYLGSNEKSALSFCSKQLRELRMESVKLKTKAVEEEFVRPFFYFGTETSVPWRYHAILQEYNQFESDVERLRRQNTWEPETLTLIESLLDRNPVRKSETKMLFLSSEAVCGTDEKLHIGNDVKSKVCPVLEKLVDRLKISFPLQNNKKKALLKKEYVQVSIIFYNCIMECTNHIPTQAWGDSREAKLRKKAGFVLESARAVDPSFPAALARMNGVFISPFESFAEVQNAVRWASANLCMHFLFRVCFGVTFEEWHYGQSSIIEILKEAKALLLALDEGALVAKEEAELLAIGFTESEISEFGISDLVQRKREKALCSVRILL